MSDTVESIMTPIRLDYRYTAGRATQRFLLGMAEGRILGQRCPSCSKVYVPPRGACPKCGVPTTDEGGVTGGGTVTPFGTVGVRADVLAAPPRWTRAQVLLDGADLPFCALIQ